MQDDLRDIQRGVAPPQPTTEAPAPAPQPATNSAVFPLPPKDAPAKQKVVLAPAVTRRRGRRLGLVVSFLLLVVILAGAAAAGWYYWYEGTSVATQPVAMVTKDAASVLPASSVVLLQYYVNDAQQRTDLAAAWQGEEVTPTLTSLLNGDPRVLLLDADLKEFFYVVLEGTSRPYLVAPKTAHTEELFGDGTASVIEKDGWYIAHALAVAPYETALTAGTVTDEKWRAFIAADSSPNPLRLVISAAGLTQLRRTLAGAAFAVGAVQELRLAGTYDAAHHSFSWQGIADTATPPQATQLPSTLLSLLPAQFSMARLGAHFHQDVTQWVPSAPAGVGEVLGQPQVRQLIEQLTASYLVYLATSGSSVDSMGVAIELPAEVSRTLTLQDPALAQAMPALLALILDQRTIASVTFTEAEYAEVPLRYANIVGSSKALDYALTDTHLLLATSKDAMFALLDTVTATTAGAAATAPWSQVVAAVGTVPAADNLLLAALPATSGLAQVFPQTAATPAAFSLQLVPDVIGTTARATLVLPQ